MKNRFGNLVAILMLALGLVGLPMISGCATSEKTTTTETTVSTDNVPSGMQTTDTQTTTRTETEVTPEEPHRGIIGGTFYVIGQVIAFPFKMIGKALDLIF